MSGNGNGEAPFYGPELPPHLAQGGNSVGIQTALADCEVIVDQYRHQRVAKAKALREIDHKLTAAASGLGAALDVDGAYSSFVQALDDYDRQEQAAVERGRAREPARDGAPNSDAHGGLAPPVLERPGGRSGDLEAQYPWSVSEIIESSFDPLKPGLTETLRLLKLFLVDPKGAKRSLLTTAHCPEFPDSEWSNLVNGRAVNLDAVLSGLFSTTISDERSESIGEGVELRFGTVAPTKVVGDAGMWNIAFDRMGSATVFVFPHRAKELRRYREYIVGLFAATNPIFHSRIISFDQAVRKRVAQRNDIELTDFSEFADIKTAVIDSIGVGVFDAQRDPTSGVVRRPKSEACNNWNRGHCTANAGSCRRLHVCNVCKLAGHKGPNCPDRQQVPAHQQN
jgi:hypothetical protein